MNQLLAMRAFVRVVEAGTFTRAAATLRIPKSTLTKLVARLEGHVRTKLLHRTTRRISVTPDGADYYERVVRLLHDVDELDGSMASSQGRPSGRLRVDVGSAVAVLVIIPALPDFHARYPEIQLDLGVSDRPVDLIGENVDCVLRAGRLTDQSLIARRIGGLKFVTCASPSYLQRHGEPQHPRDLENGHRVVGYFKVRNGHSNAFTFIGGGEQHEIAPRAVVSVDDGNAYVAAGLAGLGIIQAPSFMLEPHLASGKLRQVLTGWRSEVLPLHVVYPPNRHISNRVRVFVDWVAELIARLVAAAASPRPNGVANEPAAHEVVETITGASARAYAVIAASGTGGRTRQEAVR
jgi:LysR family transcriptional regulator, regulator for bpeEF and oprC